MTPKEQLLDFFDQAVQAVRGDNAVKAALNNRCIGDRVWMVAVGKAAASMSEGARHCLGSRLEKALLLTKYDHTPDSLRDDDRFVCHESAHPVPDQASLDAGAALVEFVAAVPQNAQLLVLVSGGASALVEKLPPSMTLGDLSRVTDFLLANGLDIGSMNVVRKSLSLIKGGRLALFLGDYPVTQLVISDVPGDSLEVIGSGLLAGSEGNRDTLLPIAQPAWLTALQRDVPIAPKKSNPIFDRIESVIVASNAIAREAAAAAAAAAGLRVIQPAENLNVDVSVAAQRILQTLEDPKAANGVYIWGGEPTVTLPNKPGRGGRNQQLALLLAKGISGKSGMDLLVCGTDGTDGPTADAGGCVDSGTLMLGQNAGLDACDFLDRADAGNYLERTGALVTTGPTGTNVMDIVLALKT